MRQQAEEIRTREILRCGLAAECTRKVLIVGYANALRCWGVDPGDCKLSDDVIHVAAQHQSARSHTRGVAAHVWKASYDVRTIPGARFLVASPQMAWAQIGQYVSLEDLVVVGSTLMCRDSRRRVASRAQFVDYVMNNPRFKGRPQCLKALPFLVENTDSPPEAVLHMLLCQHGIDGLCVNYRIRQRNHRDRFIDIAIPSVKVGIEYQGSYHSDPAQMRSDARRMNNLIALGWIILQATAEDLQSDCARGAFVESVAAQIERRRHMRALMLPEREVTSARLYS